MKTQKGFTLIELMITVAIVGILASIAVPSYQKSVMKSRREDAKGALVSFANAMERHFTETGSYCDAADTGANSCGDAGTNDTGSPKIYPQQSPVDGGVKYYDLTIDVVTDNSYILQATPINAQVNDECHTLTLSHTGKRNIDPADDTLLAQCW
jgi:type IV pilus assembly protein PilE